MLYSKTKRVMKYISIFNINHLFVTLCCALSMCLLPSCSWIEEDPSHLITDNDLEDSEEVCNQLVTGVYSKWIYDMFCWGYFPRVLEFDADYISGPDWLFGTFGAGEFQGEPELTDALWKGCFGLIRRANTAEQLIAKMQNISDETRNNAIGEIRFQKAFAYFLLVRAYGPVPIQPEVEPFDYNQARKPVTEVFEYIIRLLDESSRLMYKNTHINYRPGHVCAGSAAGLLAKVYATYAAYAMPAGTEIIVRTGEPYVYSTDNKTYAPLKTFTFGKQLVSGFENIDPMPLWQQAADWAEEVVNGTFGDYQLLDYNQLWKKTSATASEFMFSVGTVSGDATYKTAVHTQYQGYRTSTGSDFIQSGGWTGCTRHWYDLFEDNDYRIVHGVRHRWRVYTQEASNSGFFYPLNDEYSIMATGRNLNGDWVQDPTGIFADGVNYYYSTDAQCLAFTTKYEDVTDNAIANADANWPFLRYADVLLIYAEALNELDHPTDALLQLNKVRKRSNASNASIGGKNALVTKAQRRSAIIEERAREFACEADRRWDLIRWGIYLDAMNAIGGNDDGGVNKSRSERNLLFPIPVQELNTNSAIKDNNPGWQ